MQFSPEIIFILLVGIIIFNFIKDFFLDYLNSKNFNNKIPEIISDVYDSEKYLKSQEYKKTQYRFSKYSKIFSLLIILSFFYFDGFIIVDSFSRNLFKSEILISLTFFGTIFFGNELLSLPFSIFLHFLLKKNLVLIKLQSKHIFLTN
jgi:STE24 endopeptidase